MSEDYREDYRDKVDESLQHARLQQEYLEVADLLQKMREAGFYQRESVHIEHKDDGRFYTLSFYDPSRYYTRWVVTADYPSLLDFIRVVKKTVNPLKEFYTRTLLEQRMVRATDYTKGGDKLTWQKSTDPSPTSNPSENSETPTAPSNVSQREEGQ